MSIDLLHENEELLNSELTERGDPEAEPEHEGAAAEPISRFGLLSEELSGGAGAMYLREIAHHELLTAAEQLVADGFTVLPYTNDDLIAARKLIAAGASAVMPLAAPIGSGLGVQNPANLRILRERITEVPVIVDAGVGTSSDAAIAMELGCDGVLMNTAIAKATEPVRMARAMKLAVEAGREAFLAGRMAKKPYEASPSSPETGLIQKAG